MAWQHVRGIENLLPSTTGGDNRARGLPLLTGADRTPAVTVDWRHDNTGRSLSGDDK